MGRRHAKRTEDQLTILRRLCGRMEAAIEAAPPDKGVALAARLLPMAQRLEAAWRTEQAKRGPEDALEEARRSALHMRAMDDEVERLIEERVQERVAALLTPSDWELETRARDIALVEGGEWRDYLPRVHAEQRAYVESLLGVEGEAPEDSLGADP